MRTAIFIFAASILLVAAASAQHSFQTISYPDSDTTQIYRIADNGTLVGAAQIGARRHAFMEKDGRFVQLDPNGRLGTETSEARGVNSRDQVVGFYADSSKKVEVDHGFLYSDGTVTTLDFPGAVSTHVSAINKAGVIVGDFFDGEGRLHGFIWSNGAFTQIDVPGAHDTQPLGINSRGDVVGAWDAKLTDAGHGFILSGGKFVSFDAPGAGTDSTVATDVNDRGEVVGFYLEATTRAIHGFLMGMTAFASIDLPDADSSTIWGINNLSQICGNFTRGGREYGFTAASQAQNEARLQPSPMAHFGQP